MLHKLAALLNSPNSTEGVIEEVALTLASVAINDADMVHVLITEHGVLQVRHTSIDRGMG